MINDVQVNPVERSQRRLRHITSIQVVNLSLQSFLSADDVSSSNGDFIIAKRTLSTGSHELRGKSSSTKNTTSQKTSQHQTSPEARQAPPRNSSSRRESRLHDLIDTRSPQMSTPSPSGSPMELVSPLDHSRSPFRVHNDSWDAQIPRESLGQTISNELLSTFLTMSSYNTPITPVATRENSKRSLRQSESTKPTRKGLVSQRAQANLQKGRMGRQNRALQGSNGNTVLTSDGVATQDVPATPETPTLPFYISHIYPPSTNPQFNNIDSSSDFAEWSEGGSAQFKVSLWGKTGIGQSGPDSKKGKQRERSSTSEWSCLAEWHVNLEYIQPLIPPLSENAELMPDNTLILRLSSSDLALYQLRAGLKCEDKLLPDTTSISGLSIVSSPLPRSTRLSESDIEASDNVYRYKKSLDRQQLFGLLSNITLLEDTHVDLDAAIKLCDQIIADDIYGSKKRRLSQLVEVGRQLKLRISQCRMISAEREYHYAWEKEKISPNKSALLKNRNLEEGRVMHMQLLNRVRQCEAGLQLFSSRKQDVDSKLDRQRGLLFCVLNSVFLIELLSASDLLFEILDAPLPIPSNPTDPAPPLTLRNFPRFNAESLAGAYGHVAHVVQLSAAYMGVSLPYPIICIGSRSNVRDPISLMMGPRRFPLYSKGVDSYRFEYAVYLLNKNIESLMSLRELRSIDIRHTLPNLKNLLLTVSSGSGLDLSITLLSNCPKQLPNGQMGQADEFPLESSTVLSDESATPKSTSKSWSGLSFSSSWSRFRSREDVKVNSKTTEEVTRDVEPASVDIKNEDLAGVDSIQRNVIQQVASS